MTAIIIPRRHIAQPYGGVVASNLALDLGCKMLLSPATDGFSDVIGTLSVSGGAGTRAANSGALGVTRRYITAADYLFDAGKFDPRAGYAWLMTLSATSLAAWSGFFSRTADNSTAPGFSWQKYSTSNNIYVYHGVSDDGGRNLGSLLPTLLDGKPRTLVGKWDGSVVDLWADGSLIGSASYVRVPDYSAGVGQIKIGSSRDVAGLTGNVYSAALFSAISSDAAKELSANPWQLFRADPIRIYSFPAGPIIPSLSGLTTSHITSSGARHSLTLTY